MGLKVTWEMEQGAEFELPDGASFGLWRMDDGAWMAASGGSLSCERREDR